MVSRLGETLSLKRESDNLDIWDSIEECPFILTMVVNVVKQLKPKCAWTNEEKNRVQNDLNVVKQHALKSKKDKKNKRANVISEDNDIGSNVELKFKEQSQISLMDSHQSEDDYEVSNSEPNDTFLYDELQNIFNGLHEKYNRLSKLCIKQKHAIERLEGQNEILQKDLDTLRFKSNYDCIKRQKCDTLETKIISLNQELNVF
ncbi:hypothetical protein Lal_00020981 [Lupinus albus]|nr:hypothetical protein Lal_00020981 [Lupinus albus]